MRIRLLIPFFIAIFLFFLPEKSSAQFYIGAGANYTLPQGEFGDLNQNSLGLDILLENRRLCNWWYGFRVQYNSYDPLDNLESTDDYFTESLIISPQVRYNFLYDDKYDSNLFPYLQGSLLINTFNNTDDSGDLGVGLSGGAGLCYGLCLSGVCFIIDLNAVYGAPNYIISDADRFDINYISTSLTLSVGL